MTPTRPGMNGATHTSGWPANRATRAPSSTVAASTRCGRDLHAGHEVALVDDLAIERGEHLERIDPVDPLELGDPDVEHARKRGQQVHPALGRSTDRQARTGDGRGQAQRGIVLVEFAGLGDEDGHRRPVIGGREDVQVVGGQPPALRPAVIADRQVPREDGADQARRGTAAWRDPFEPHA